MAEDQPQASVSGGRRWQGSGSAAGSQRGSTSRLARIFGILAVMLILLGGVALLARLWNSFQEPYFLSIPVSQYSHYYPPNAFVDRDSELLRARFTNSSHEAFRSQEKARLEEELKRLRDNKAKAVVVHLSAQAITRDGKVYLLPGDAQPEQPRSWLELGDVLQLIQDCPAKQKLLVLDIMRPTADAYLGVLANDVAERVQSRLEEMQNKKELPFFILCPCSRGQFSLTSEELGQSVFGYYLDQGLAGLADGYQDKPNARVSVREVFAFVQARVDRWAMHNHNTRQTPLLFAPSANADFDLVGVAGKSVADDSESQEDKPAPEYPAWLKQRWTERDDWLRRADHRLAPRTYRQMETRLLWNEQRWRAGVGPTEMQEDLNDQFRQYGRELDQARTPIGDLPRSLALFTRDQKPDAAAREKLQELLAIIQKMPPPTGPPDPTKKPDPATQKSLDEIEAGKKALLDPFKGKSDLLAWAIVDVATEDVAPSPAKLSFLVDLLKSVPPASEPFREAAYLQKLASLKTEEGVPWPTEAVHRALRIEQQAEKATTYDPQALPYVRLQLDAAAKKRRSAEDLLFKAEEDSLNQAKALFEETQRQYEQILAAMSAVQEGQRSWDRASVLLPGYASYRLARPGIGYQDDSEWSRAIGNVVELGNRLAEPAAQQLPAVDDLRGVTEALDNHLRKLRRPIDQVRKSLDPAHGTASDLVEAMAVLESPCLAAGEREELWVKQRLLARRLHQETVDLDRAEDRSHARTAAVDRPGGSAGEDARARLRARLAVDQLTLGASGELGAKIGKLEDGMRALKASAAPETWQAVGLQIRDVWVHQVPKQFDDFMISGQLPAADRLSRVMHPFDRDPKAADQGVSRNPTATLNRTKILEFRRWLFEP